MGYSFRLAARVLLYAPSHRQNSTYHGLCYTSRGALVGTRNNSMCPQWGINPTNHRTTNECSYYGTRPYIFENGRCYERLTADFCLDVNVYSFHTLLIQKINLGGDPNITRRAGCSSVDSVPAFEAVGRRIDPSQWIQLQFGLFSVPTSGPQLVYQRPWYVLFCLWKSAYKRSLAAYRKE